MPLTGKIIFILILLCNTRLVYGQADSTLPGDDCTSRFFQRSGKPAANAKLITKANKTIAINQFISPGEPGNNYTGRAIADLDNDGKQELVLINYTGGAHCCDEVYIFRNIAPGKYQYAAKLFAGNTCITDSNLFTYDFYEQFGYFFTCFACSYPDTTDTAPEPVHAITLKYNKGKLNLIPGDKDLRSTIRDNLGKLGEQPYENLAGSDIAQDNGLRKEFAMNLAVFYYSFGKNLAETQQLFKQFYKYPDAQKVWTGFIKQLAYIKKDNDF